MAATWFTARLSTWLTTRLTGHSDVINHLLGIDIDTTSEKILNLNKISNCCSFNKFILQKIKNSKYPKNNLQFLLHLQRFPPIFDEYSLMSMQKFRINYRAIKEWTLQHSNCKLKRWILFPIVSCTTFYFLYLLFILTKQK
jgi:hypothetical protein